MEHEKSSKELESLFSVILAFNSINDRTMLLNNILTNMMQITHSDAGTLYVLEGETLHFKIIQNKTLGISEIFEDGNATLPPIQLDENNIQNVSAYVALKNKMVVVDDVYTDNTFDFTGTKKYDELTGYTTKSMFVCPICAHREDGDEILGVLQLMNPMDKETGEIVDYSDFGNQNLVLALTKISANTLSNLAHVSELQGFLRAFAAALTTAIDERSRYNGSHTQNVAQYCELFATYLNRVFPEGHKYHFNSFHIESITLAALLHDIGKMITPLRVMDKANRLSDRLDGIRYRFGLKKLQLYIEHLEGRMPKEAYQAKNTDIEDVQHFIEQVNLVNFLTDEQAEKIKAIETETYIDVNGNSASLLEEEDIASLSIKRGTLTPSERKIMEEHVEITSRVLQKIPFRKYYAQVPNWAGAHHEFLDGTGYPKGLKEEEIPMEACIITIMDIFDALIDTNRPYKRGVPLDKALSILQEMANDGKLHKELVELFIQSKLWEKCERF